MAPGEAGLEIEVLGIERVRGELTEEDAALLCARALGAAGIDGGHLAVEFLDGERMRELNLRHRGRDAPTDVLSFPVDAEAPALGPRELGDVVISPEHTGDLREALVHGVLHLAGMDHETDGGEMLVLQREVLAWRAP